MSNVGTNGMLVSMTGLRRSRHKKTSWCLPFRPLTRTASPAYRPCSACRSCRRCGTAYRPCRTCRTRRSCRPCRSCLAYRSRTRRPCRSCRACRSYRACLQLLLHYYHVRSGLLSLFHYHLSSCLLSYLCPWVVRSVAAATAGRCSGAP